VLESQISRITEGILAPGRKKFTQHTPASILPEPIENLSGAMGQKSVQFGKGTPLTPAAMAEIKTLLGDLQRILGQ
jgi:hypothetical protein